MNSLLSKLLRKRNITREDLDESEKEDFSRWEKILSEGEITVEKIQRFCEAQKSAIELQWRDMSNDSAKNNRLIVAHNIYSTIIKAITAPEVERVSLEDYLNKLING